jgi:hypothetical protein
MSVVIRIMGVADGRPSTAEGLYVRDMDVDAHEGRGLLDATPFVEDALHFESHADALAYWQRVSDVAPVRPDGKPNRPLTAYTVTLEQGS